LNPDEEVAIRMSPYIRRAVDMLKLGILLVDSDCCILFANRGADLLLRRRVGLTVQNRQLRADTPQTTHLLERELRAAISAHSDRGDSVRVLALPRSSGRAMMVLIFPCRHEMSFGSKEPVAVLFLSAPMERPDIDERHVALAYGLTRAETRLLCALLDGKRLGDYAREAGITLFTAKGYLKQIFIKTGVNRQADLVRLILGDPALRLVAMTDLDRVD